MNEVGIFAERFCFKNVKFGQFHFLRGFSSILNRKRKKAKRLNVFMICFLNITRLSGDFPCLSKKTRLII
jgi:hypothetical protein